MIARQTNSQSFKIRINFVSKIFWFKVHGFFADRTTYMFQRLPVGGEVMAVKTMLRKFKCKSKRKCKCKCKCKCKSGEHRMQRCLAEDHSGWVGRRPVRHEDDSEVPPHLQVRPAQRKLSKGELLSSRNRWLICCQKIIVFKVSKLLSGAWSDMEQHCNGRHHWLASSSNILKVLYSW